MANDERMAKNENYDQTSKQVPELVKGQWSDLLGDLLDIIEGHLTLYVDKVHIRAICMSWYSHLPKIYNLQSRRHPWLLLACKNEKNEEGKEEEDDDEDEDEDEDEGGEGGEEGEEDEEGEGEGEGESHALFDPFENKFYYLDLPEAKGKLFKGSSYGWFVTMEDRNSTSPADMYLINPLTRATIQLPPRSTFPDVKEYHPDKVGEEYTLFNRDGSDFFITDEDHLKILTFKVVLSSTPTSEDCVVVAIYGQYKRLAFCKCNDVKWIQVNVQAPYSTGFDDVIFYNGFDDVIFYNEKLYALAQNGSLIVVEDIMDPNPKSREIVAVKSNLIRSPLYLVECDGELFMVKRYREAVPPNKYRETVDFLMSKLDLRKSRWVEVESIGENVLFLGSSTSISISGRAYNKRESIFYTDLVLDFASGRKYGFSDIGMFDLEEETFDEFPDFPIFLWPPPIWLAPE